MAAFQKFNFFVEHFAEKAHDLQNDTLKLILSNTAPNVDTSITLAQSSEIAAGNGYTSGGKTITITSSAQTSGTYKLVGADPTPWQAAGGSIGPFRYVILRNATADKNIGFWDYGSSITLADTESFTPDLDQTNGILTLA
jgi:hypothetical protein